MNEREEKLFLNHIEKVQKKQNCVRTKREHELYTKLCNELTGDQKVLLDLYMDLYSDRQNEIAKEMFLCGINESHGKKQNEKAT